MSEIKRKATDEDAATAEEKPSCTCVPDPFTSLPPELRPRPAAKNNGLRQVTCPGCGKNYLTNRATDLCFDCE